MRAFFFGCSFTTYAWPTWADLLAYHYHLEGNEVYVYGKAGLGNMGILQTIMLVDQIYKFTPDDIICVVWSSMDRVDFIEDIDYGEFKWTAGGSIYTNCNLDTLYADTFHVWQQDIFSTATAINCANKIANISFNGMIEPYEGYDKLIQTRPGLEGDLKNRLIKEKIRCADLFADIKNHQNFYDSLRDVEVRISSVHDDGHPLPNVAYSYVSECVAPALGIKLNPKVNNVASATTDIIYEEYSKGSPADDYFDARTKIEKQSDKLLQGRKWQQFDQLWSKDSISHHVDIIRQNLLN